MDTTAIYIAPDENFDDWVVRDESGHELGHYPTSLDFHGTKIA